MKIRKNRISEALRRLTAGFLAVLLLLESTGPCGFKAYASSLGGVGTVIRKLGPYMDNTLQCIDAYAELGPEGGYEHDDDSYIRVQPSETLSKYEEGLVFWGTFFLFAVIPASAEGSYPGMSFDGIRSAYAALSAAGLPTEGIYYQDFNRLIHNPSIQAKYPLIRSLAQDDTKASQYLTAMGLMGGGTGTGMGGRTVPSVFSGHMSLDTRLVIGSSLTVDTGDPEFLRQVKIEFAPSDDSGSFFRRPVNGWNYVINGSEVSFSNSSDDKKGVFVRFNTEGTDYAAKGGGTFTSPFETYEELLEVWAVENCTGGKNGNILRPSQHQRFASLNFESISSGMPYAELGMTAPGGSDDAGFMFTSYRHEENFTSHYNLKLFKGDFETGHPLSGASFTVYESSSGSLFTDKGGVTTGTDGTALKTVEHHETFSATFCDGHPAPVFTFVPEEETDPETGEVLNEDDILYAQEANTAAAEGWLETLSDCESKSGSGHYHFVMSGVSEGEISYIASCGGDPGEAPDAGPTESLDGDSAFSGSGCEAARDSAYERFINKEYYYTFTEVRARSGYVRHGKHDGDIPIEVIKTDSSEAGAHSSYTGRYSDSVSTGGSSYGLKALSAPKKLSEIKAEHSYVLREETEGRRLSFGTLLKAAVRSLFGTGGSAATPSEVKRATESEHLFYEDQNEAIKESEEKEEESGADSADEVFETADTETDEVSVDEVNEITEVSFLPDLPGGAAERLKGLFTIDAYAASGCGPEGIFYAGYGESDYQDAGSDVIPGRPDNLSHCNNEDGEGNMWRIYDHRTEGEIHINKRDYDLSDNTSSLFDDYAEENGDGVLSGAVYGLFAASSVIHPDGHTGVVFAPDDLVAVSVTDRDGNAVFTEITAAPDSAFDYEHGTVIRRNRRNISPITNLYDRAHTENDYGKGGYSRKYEDLKSRNGNEWIGRPLLMGSYYVKELTRSEGYELSIGRKDNIISNFGQDRDAGTKGAAVTGTAVVSKAPWSDVQIKGGRALSDLPDPGDHDYNEIYFDITSKGTGTEGYEMKLSQFPAGTRIYRLSEGSGTVTYEVGTGTYDTVTVLDENGDPIPLSAVTGYDYPVYDSTGVPETYIVYPDDEVKNIVKLYGAPPDPAKAAEAILSPEDGMDEAAVSAKLSEIHDPSSDMAFVKAKTERALRQNGKGTPKAAGSYSSVTAPVFDNGDTAEGTFGAPVIRIKVPGPLTNADLIESILSFYSDSPYFTYGGISSVRSTGTEYEIEVYAGTSAMKPFYTEVSGVSAVFRPVEHEAVSDDMQRYVWAVYTDTLSSFLPDGMPVFGRYEDMTEAYGRISAVLITKAEAKDPVSYDLSSCEAVRTRFYPAGTCPVYDASGNVIYKTEYRERKVKRNVGAPEAVWTFLAETASESGTVHVDTAYTDAYGVLKNDAAGETAEFLAVVPSDEDKHVVLTAEDVELLGGMNPAGLKAGDRISAGEWYTLIKKVSVSVKIGSGSLSGLTGPDSYIETCDLDYPGQETVIWDAGTKMRPVILYERPVRQSVKVSKRIDTDSSKNNTYGAAMVSKVTNFRFRAYLKSNLTRLCRSEDGSITWVDENGNRMEPVIVGGEVTWRFLTGKSGSYRWPETDKSTGLRTALSIMSVNVQPIRTEETSVKILETLDGKLNYEKFFDAVDAANTDKWDDNAPAYTSQRPVGNAANRSVFQKENAKRSDCVRRFAVKWYLKDEAAALTKNVPGSLTGYGYMEREALRERSENNYSEALYDEALYNAIIKAEDYLRPFFKYDLDAVYSIRWDRDEGGGTDRDFTTLSADSVEKDGTFNYSAYLPYGEYVIAEQQPRYTGSDAAAFNDFINKWYRKDTPHEVKVPTVYDGSLSHRDIPYTLTVPDVLTDYSAEEFSGFADVNAVNELYSTRLRIEKLDSETNENILHDDAVFSIYKAERDLTTGDVLTYTEDTVITGSRDFIYSYCIRDSIEEIGSARFKGIAAAGTPICSESDQVTLAGCKSFSTSVKTAGKKEETNLYTIPETYITQNAGYLETEVPLGAGTYVLTETKVPAGYVRTKPVAIEVYSDKVTYFLNGERTEAVSYEDEGKTGLYVPDAPIKLTVEKVKESSETSADKNADKTVTYRYSGRTDGSIAELSDRDDLIYAYNDAGLYQGYAWKKGTLLYLSGLKKLYENDDDPLTEVQIVYSGDLFAGYGYIKRPLLTADDGNKYVAGAVLTLFEALELKRDEGRTFGKSDYSFKNLTVERNKNSSVKSMKAEGRDILYYSFDDLKVTEKRNVSGKEILYGYDKNHALTEIRQLVSDGLNYGKDDSEVSIYGFAGGIPVFEFTGGDLTKVSYSKENRTVTADAGTLMYHLDPDGNRDALVDPYNGMAYVRDGEKYLVWTVDISRDASGNTDTMDKITTSRPATVGENDESLYGDAVTISKAVRPDGAAVPGTVKTYTYPETGSVTGSWISDGSGSSHGQISVKTDINGRNQNGETLITENTGSFRKEYDPVYDRYGNTVYYQKSPETYEKGTELYDRMGDYVRYDFSDELKESDDASYSKHEEPEKAENIYHRYGEGYVLQNTWITSGYAPNDPFNEKMTDGQADVLKRVPAGTYICEELAVPGGYIKSMPAGVTVEEKASMQYVKMTDRTVKLEISKVSGRTYELVPGAELSLYPAKRVYSPDYDKYPKGYFLVKTDDEPLTFKSTDWTLSDPVTLKASWITDKKSTVYAEGIPKGDYILCETKAPEGYIKAEPVEIEIGASAEVYGVTLCDEETRFEIEKFYIDNETKQRKQLKGADFALYKTVTGPSGNVLTDGNGAPLYGSEVLSSWTSSNDREWTDFASQFEKAYTAHGTDMHSFGFLDDDGMPHDGTVTEIQKLDPSLEGGMPMTYPTAALITVTDEFSRVTKIKVTGQRPKEGKLSFTFDFMFDYKELPLINGHAVSFTDLSGVRCFLGLPADVKFAAVEERVPEGFEGALPKLVYAEDKNEVRRFSIKNTEKERPEEPVPEKKETEVHFHKTDAVTGEELPGAHVEIRDEEGNLTDEWISADTPHEIKGVLEAGKKYRFIETIAPEGYELTNDVEFTVNDDGTPQQVYMEDKPVEKTPEPTTAPVPETEAPSETPSETPAPEAPETVPVPEKHIPAVTRYDPEKEYLVTIRKTDGVTGAGAEGAEFSLYDRESGELLDRLTADRDGKCVFTGLKAGKHYSVRETKAPEGYNMSPEIKHFTVKETYKNDGTVYWVDQPRRFKKFGFLYATGDDSPPLLLLAADLLVLLIAYILVSRKDKKHEK